MATWLDVFSLVATLAVFGGTIYGVLFIMKQISNSVQTTKENLKTRGLHISDTGMSVKTSKRFDREDYVDATQRGIVKAMGAASFRKADEQAAAPAPSSSKLFGMHRQTSSSSLKTTNSEEKKKSIFGRKGSNRSRDKDL